MLFNAKVIGGLLAIAIASITTAFYYFFSGPQSLLLFFILVFFAVFLTVFGALQFFIFSEIAEIYELLSKFKKKDYNIFLRKETGSESNPLFQIKREIVEFAEKKQREINELKKLETFRREFLADVSHELKTPIFAAQGFVHTLIDGAIDDYDVRDKFLEKAAISLDGLNVLVEDLITISQLEIGEIKMQYQSFDLRRITEDIFDQVEELAKKRGTRLVFYKYAPKSCYIFADKLRISQVMTNLIVNAIKYGKDKGTVMVSFAVENEDVYVSVKDNGPGIEAQHLERIFERFYRIDKSRSKDKGGSGLGLSIVKHILEAHSSKIYVSSKEKQGTIFSFKLKKGKVINEKG